MYSTILLYLFVVPNAWLPRDRKEVPRRETELAELMMNNDDEREKLASIANQEQKHISQGIQSKYQTNSCQ